MEVSIVEQNLKQAREHIALGSRHIARQREIVAEIKERGGNSAEAERLLAAFEHSQAMHLEHRDRLERELEAFKSRN